MKLRRSILVAALALAVGCEGGAAPAVDAGGDASATPFASLPVLTPCPDGWTEVRDATGLVTCDPWGGAGYQGDACAFDEAHFPGAPGCARVGPPCPADGWPADLPSDRAVVFVDDDAALGGDGRSRATAYRTIADALATAPDAAVVALAVGHYDEYVSLDHGVALVGACVDGSRITCTSVSDTLPTLHMHDGTSARDLGLEAPRRVGVAALVPGSVTLTNVVVSHAERVGLWVAMGSVAATDVVVRGTVPGGSADLGDAVLVRAGGTLTADGLVADASADVGLYLPDAATLTVQRGVVHGPPSVAPGLGSGITMSAGAQATLSRSAFEASQGGALLAVGATTSLRMTDVLVHATYGEVGEVRDGASLTLVRVVIDGGEILGLSVKRAGTLLDASDLVLRGIAPAPDTSFGAGMQVVLGAHATLARTRIEDVHTAGLIASETDTAIDATDLVVRDVHVQVSDGSGGVGIWSQRSATVTLTRARVEDVSEAGVASLTSSRVLASELSVLRVGAASCPAGICTGTIGGHGLLATLGGTISATSFSIEDASLCGVLVGGDGMLVPTGLDLSRGTITRAPVGACVQAPGFDVERLHDRVEYAEVGVPLQATSYVLPTSL